MSTAAAGDFSPASENKHLQWYQKLFSDALFYSAMAFLGLLFLFLIILIKSKTLTNYDTNFYLLVYTVLVTSFELSRVTGAMLYRNSINRVMDHADTVMARQNIDYEPTVTFVIPCKNEGPDIRNTVEKCFEADYPHSKLDVIVINDGSTDTTGKVLRELKKEYDRLTVVTWRKNRGKRHGMAEGFKRAKGEIIIQLDSDSYIDPSTVRNLIKPFIHEEIGAVCAHAEPQNADKNLLTKMQAGYYFMSFRILKSAESVFMTVFCASGCSSAYRKSVVLPIMDDWLNERFWGKPVTWGDDRALTNWVIKRGSKTIYTDLARAYTICPENLRQFLKQQARWKKSWIINSYFASKFIIKERPLVALFYFFPLTIVTLLTPFMAVRALVVTPVFYHQIPVYYALGVLLIAGIMTVFYRCFDRSNKYWPYVTAWAGMNMLVLSFILFYSALTIQNRGWGTR